MNVLEKKPNKTNHVSNYKMNAKIMKIFGSQLCIIQAPIIRNCINHPAKKNCIFWQQITMLECYDTTWFTAGSQTSSSSSSSSSPLSSSSSSSSPSSPPTPCLSVSYDTTLFTTELEARPPVSWTLQLTNNHSPLSSSSSSSTSSPSSSSSSSSSPSSSSSSHKEAAFLNHRH